MIHILIQELRFRYTAIWWPFTFKLNPSWYRHICNVTLAMVEISLQYCPSNYNSTWPYLRGGSPKPDLRPSITAQPGRYLSVNADSLPAHLILSVLVFNIGWLKGKTPVPTGTMMLYSIILCKGENWIRCFQARGLGMPSCPSRTMCPSRSESWNGSRITRYEENEEHTTISDVYKNNYTKRYTKWYINPYKILIHGTVFWYTVLYSKVTYKFNLLGIITICQLNTHLTKHHR